MSDYSITDFVTGRSYLCSGKQTLLSAMEYRGEKIIDIGCRGGGCGRCKIQLLAGDVKTGKMSKEHINDEQLDQGLLLACKAYPKSDVLFEFVGLSKATRG